MGGAMPSIYRSASLLSTFYIAKKFTHHKNECDKDVETVIGHKDDDKDYKTGVDVDNVEAVVKGDEEPVEKLNPMYYAFESKPIYEFSAVNADSKNVSLAEHKDKVMLICVLGRKSKYIK